MGNVKTSPLPKWKQDQRRRIHRAKTITGDAVGWKIPRTGLRIPTEALLAMNDHGS